MGNFFRQIKIFLLFYVVWVMLTYSLHTQELIAGFIVSIILAIFVHNYTDFGFVDTLFNPIKIINLIIYFFVFLIVEIKSHILVAKAIITGNVNPAIVKIVPEFKTEIGRSFLANSITLTPGTVSVSIGKALYVHCLDYNKGDDVDGVFTKYGRRVFK